MARSKKSLSSRDDAALEDISAEGVARSGYFMCASRAALARGEKADFFGRWVKQRTKLCMCLEWVQLREAHGPPNQMLIRCRRSSASVGVSSASVRHSGGAHAMATSHVESLLVLRRARACAGESERTSE